MWISCENCRAPKAGREIVASTVSGLPMSSPSQTWRNRRTICESKDGEDDFFPWCRLGHILSIWTKCVREIAKDQAANGSRFFMTLKAMGGRRVGSRSRRRRRTASSSGGASGRRERKRCGGVAAREPRPWRRGNLNSVLKWGHYCALAQATCSLVGEHFFAANSLSYRLQAKGICGEKILRRGWPAFERKSGPI